MNLVQWTLSLGLVKGLVFGLRPYEFWSKEGEEPKVYEVDHVLYLGFIQLILTTVYAEQSEK